MRGLLREASSPVLVDGISLSPPTLESYPPPFPLCLSAYSDTLSCYFVNPLSHQHGCPRVEGGLVCFVGGCILLSPDRYILCTEKSITDHKQLKFCDMGIKIH